MTNNKEKTLDECCSLAGKKFSQPQYCNHYCHKNSKEKGECDCKERGFLKHVFDCHKNSKESYCGCGEPGTYGVVHRPNKPCYVIPKEPSTWEERFEKQHRWRGCNEADYHKIKSFIRTLLEEARERGYSTEGAAYDSGYQKGHAQAIKEVVEIIESNKRVCPNHGEAGVECYGYDEEFNAGLSVLQAKLKE